MTGSDNPDPEQNNTYATSSVSVPFKLWSTHARLNRSQYFVLSFGLPALLFFSIVLLSPSLKVSLYDSSGSASLNAVFVFMLFVSLLLVVLFIQLIWAIRRCYDLDRSAWLAVLWFIPLVNLPFWLMAGTTGANRNGPQPVSSTFWRLAAIALAGIYAATFTTLYLVGTTYNQDRIARQQVAQCLKSSRHARLAVSHYVRDAGRFIDKEMAKALFNPDGIRTEFCTQTIDIKRKFITAQFNSNDALSPELHNATVFFVPRPERADAKNGDVKFRCVSDDIDTKHLPRRCAL